MSDNWIIYIPIVIAAGGLGLSIWNARTSARKDTVDTKTSEVDKYIEALKGQIDIHEKEIADLKITTQMNNDDMNKRMLACEAAREDLVKRNVALQEENIGYLKQLVVAGVIAQIKK